MNDPSWSTGGNVSGRARPVEATQVWGGKRLVLRPRGCEYQIWWRRDCQARTRWSLPRKERRYGYRFEDSSGVSKLRCAQFTAAAGGGEEIVSSPGLWDSCLLGDDNWRVSE